jgi:hypothetical protein
VNKKNPRIKHLFAVEIWREASENGAGSWRGIVKHIAHDHQSYFHSIVDLTDYISLRLAAPAADAGHEDGFL